MPRRKSPPKSEINRAITTAIAAGLVVSRIIVKPQSVELVMGAVDESGCDDQDGAKPKSW